MKSFGQFINEVSKEQLDAALKSVDKQGKILAKAQEKRKLKAPLSDYYKAMGWNQKPTKKD